MKTLVKKLDFYKPLSEVFEQYHKQDRVVFLDSSLHNELGRYSIIGLNPYMQLKEKDGVCYCEEKPQKYSLEEFLRTYLRDNQEENPTQLPLISGAIGYFSYDYGRKFETIKTRHEQSLAMPDAYICFYDNLVIEDCEKK